MSVIIYVRNKRSWVTANGKERPVWMSQGTGNQALSCDIFKNQVDPLLAGIVSPTHTAIDDITYT